LAEKRIKEAKAQIDTKKAVVEESTKLYKERKKDLDLKKKELDDIIAETEKEEKDLQKKSRCGFQAHRRAVAQRLPPHPQQRAQRPGRGAGSSVALRWLLQRHPAPAPAGHQQPQEDHRVRALRSHPGG
jgi:hypothetical protein